jgi:hypothetical protein
MQCLAVLWGARRACCRPRPRVQLLRCPAWCGASGGAWRCSGSCCRCGTGSSEGSAGSALPSWPAGAGRGGGAGRMGMRRRRDSKPPRPGARGGGRRARGLAVAALLGCTMPAATRAAPAGAQRGWRLPAWMATAGAPAGPAGPAAGCRMRSAVPAGTHKLHFCPERLLARHGGWPARNTPKCCCPTGLKEGAHPGAGGTCAGGHRPSCGQLPPPPSPAPPARTRLPSVTLSQP